MKAAIKTFASRSALITSWVALFISIGVWGVETYVTPWDAKFGAIMETGVILMGSTIATISNSRPKAP